VSMVTTTGEDIEGREGGGMMPASVAAGRGMLRRRLRPPPRFKP
jgi:hypothetical protein